MKHFYHNVPGWFSFCDEYDEAIKRASKDVSSIFIECGSYKGKSTSYMGVEIANSNKPITFYAVDTFEGSEEHERKGFDITNLYWEFENNVSLVREHINVLFMKTNQAHKLFENGSVDFVFLDASHQYEDVLEDLRNFWPKLKPGGMIAGDDYKWRSVQEAVHEFFGDEVYVRNKSWKVYK